MLENSRRTAALAALSFALVACLDVDSSSKIITDPPMQPGSGVVMQISGWPEPFAAIGELRVDSATGVPAWARSAGYLASGDIIAADVGETGTGDIAALSLSGIDAGEYPFDPDCEPRKAGREKCAIGVLSRGATGWDSAVTERWEFVSGTVTVRSSDPKRIEGTFSGTVQRVDESSGEVTGTADVTRGEFGVYLVGSDGVRS